MASPATPPPHGPPAATASMAAADRPGDSSASFFSDADTTLDPFQLGTVVFPNAPAPAAGQDTSLSQLKPDLGQEEEEQEQEGEGGEEGGEEQEREGEHPVALLSRAVDLASQHVLRLQQALYTLEEARHTSVPSTSPGEATDREREAHEAHVAVDKLMIELDAEMYAANSAFASLDTRLSSLPAQEHQEQAHSRFTMHPSSSSASLVSASSFDDELWAAGDLSSSMAPAKNDEAEDSFRLPSLSSSSRAIPALQTRAQSLLRTWAEIQDEVDVARRELVEDKHHRAFAGVVSHAHELMDSLARALDAQQEVLAQWPQVEQASLASLSDPENWSNLESSLVQADEYGTTLSSVGRKTEVKLAYYLPSVQRAFTGLAAMLSSRHTAHGGAERMRLDAVNRWEELKDKSEILARQKRKILLAHRQLLPKLAQATLNNPEPDPNLQELATSIIATANEDADLSNTSTSLIAPPPSASVGQRSSPPQIQAQAPFSSSPPNPTNVPVSSSSTPKRKDLSLPISRLRTTQRTTLNTPSSSRTISGSSPVISPPSSIGRSGPVPGPAGNAKPPTRPWRHPRRISDAQTFSHSAHSASTSNVIPSKELVSPSLRPSQARSLGRVAARAVSGPHSSKKDDVDDLVWQTARMSLGSQPTTGQGSKDNKSVLGLSVARSIYDDAPPLPPTTSAWGGASPLSSTSASGETTSTTTTVPSVDLSSSRSEKRLSRIPRLSAYNPTSRPPSARSARPTSALSSIGPEGLTPPLRPNSLIRSPSQMTNLPSTPTRRPRGPPPTSRSAQAARQVRSRPPQTPDPIIAQRAQRLSAFGPTRVPASPLPSDGKLKRWGSAMDLHTSSLSPNTGTTSSPRPWSRTSLARPSSRLRPASRIEGPTYGEGSGGTYVPNPNDILDVEVGGIANALGVSIARLEPPLPKGQKIQLAPGKEVQARYALAGRPVACKLLLLHRPGGHAGVEGGRTTMKVMVRAEGFWQDLETWLLSRLE